MVSLLTTYLSVNSDVCTCMAQTEGQLHQCMAHRACRADSSPWLARGEVTPHDMPASAEAEHSKLLLCKAYMPIGALALANPAVFILAFRQGTNQTGLSSKVIDIACK